MSSHVFDMIIIAFKISEMMDGLWFRAYHDANYLALSHFCLEGEELLTVGIPSIRLQAAGGEGCATKLIETLPTRKIPEAALLFPFTDILHLEQPHT